MDSVHESFTDEQITEFQEAFNLFPQEQKGHIELELLETALKSLGHHPTQDDMQNLYRYCEGCEGKLSFNMFLSAMALLVAACSKDEIRAAFGMFDKDGNGTIDSRELRDVMLNLGEALTDEEVDDMIREIDVDGDGEVDCEEFVMMMKNEEIKK